MTARKTAALTRAALREALQKVTDLHNQLQAAEARAERLLLQNGDVLLIDAPACRLLAPMIERTRDRAAAVVVPGAEGCARIGGGQ